MTDKDKLGCIYIQLEDRLGNLMQLTLMSAGKGEKQEVKLTGAQKEQKLQNKTGRDLKQKA